MTKLIVALHNFAKAYNWPFNVIKQYFIKTSGG